MTLDFGEVLSRAWRITWKYKVLWLFGILAVGFSQGFNIVNQFVNRGIQMVAFGPTPPELRSIFGDLRDFPFEVVIVAGVLVFLVFLIATMVFSAIGEIACILGVRRADLDADRLTFGGLLRDSMPFFWRVLGLNLLVSLTVFVVMLLIMLPAILLSIVTFGLGMLCIFPLFCLLIPFSYVLGVIILQAINALVIEDLGVFAAIRRGWEVSKANAGNLFLMSLIVLLGIGMIVGVIIALPMLVVMMPMTFSMSYNVSSGVGYSSLWNQLLIGGLCLLAYLPVLVVLSGVINVYSQAAWTLTYLRLTARPAAPIESESLPAPVE